LVPSPKYGSQEETQKDRVQKIAGKNIGPQTHSQREHAGAGTDDLDGKDQRGEQRDRPGEMFKVGNMAMMPNSLPVKIEKGKYRGSQRETGVCRRRREERENTTKNGQQKEYG